MRNQYLQVSFLFIMIMISFFELSNCRDIHRSTTEGTTTNMKPGSHSSFPSRFPAKAPVADSNPQTDPIYGMSKRTVPGGPNPLHN
ncbi:hypothetical protein DCAR_0209507 [Daucus carota subsp. sativus]|uniref:Uncharacterized protein n=1 Tax=Daucus carota subsp. sativus TaxID=79200 RepID=A0A166FB31_DAUCS|nr:hypothetical protein DCAR_0209507 [Daucus carota subsp. sativus]